MVSVSESLEVAYTLHHTFDKGSADSSCSMGAISSLIMAEQPARFQALKLRQEVGEFNTSQAFRNLAPM
jgi:hypothetical protein